MRARLLRRIVPALAVAMLATLGLAGPAPARQDLPFHNPRLSVDSRVQDLLGRLTVDEKISLLHQYQPAIPRLGIRSFRTGTEALHGLTWLGEATVFPQAIGLASTWDPNLIKQVGSAVGDEARGLQQERPAGWGLNLWAPVVNLLRDPRWGRNEEGYSEDPYLTGAISTAYGHGMEGDDPRYLKAAPTLKHYLANNNEVNRATASSQLRPRVLHEYDQAAFKPAISADAATGVMASYNLVNGRPNTVNPDLDEAVRSWTDKDLLNVTDAFAPNNLLPGGENYYDTLPEADAAALRAGIDSYTTDDADSAKTTTAINQALSQGLIKESDIDRAARHILSIRVRLGEFDPDGGPYATIDRSVINNPEHRELARKTADEAVVLLKNGAAQPGKGKTLPLKAGATKKVAVVGPLEDTLYTDWYSGSLPYQVTPLQGIKERLGSAASVSASEGVDRIMLKDASTGKYITAGGGVAGATLKESATTPGSTEQFDAFDWGKGILALRSAANAKYVGFDGTDFANDQAQPNGWFVQQQFALERQDDGTYVIRYAGYDADQSWFGPNKYLRPKDDGTLTLTTANDAAHFTREIVSSGVDSAVKAATGADAAVVVVGSMPFINGREDHDRTDMDLAAGQEALVKAVRKANPNTIVVLENSYPDTITWEQDNVPALLWTTHAGQETGHAIADVLFGDHNPSGRLTQTWYRSAAELPDILNYDIIKADRTYQYYRGDPLYPFGHGLSYTSFRYGPPRLSGDSINGSGKVTVQVQVTNTGERDGAEVVQLYTHQRTSRDKQPVKQLRAFQRVELRAGQSKQVRLTLNAADLAHWDVTRDRPVVESGTYEVMVGASAKDIRGSATLTVNGERIPARDLARPTRAVNFDDYAAGLHLVDETKATGYAVATADAPAWIRFTDVDLRRGASAFTAQAAKASPGAGTVQIRLDDPKNGKLLGTAPVASTGDIYRYAPATATVSGASGRHDIYLVLSPGLRLSTFSLR